MRQKFGGELGWRGAGLVLLLMFLLAAPRMIPAQDEQVDGGAFTGGRMVRGTVTAVTADRLTVKTEDGEIYQVAVSTNTRMMKEHQPVKIGDIKAGDGVGAMGVLDAPAKTVHAVLVAVMDAAQVKKAREDLGKLYITGRVMSVDMDDARVTVKRPDGVTQVIQADEGTSFKRGGRRAQIAGNGTSAAEANGRGESITLADLKVGDLVMGAGAVKNGMFVPTELRVLDVAARGQGRRRGAGVGSANADGAGSSK